jgi:hypothetical protein
MTKSLCINCKKEYKNLKLHYESNLHKNNSYEKNNKFIEKAMLIHKENYEYSKINYINDDKEIIINCKIHGVFHQKPYAHLKGMGCYNCYVKKHEDIKKKYGDNLYDIVKCTNADTNIILKCKKCFEIIYVNIENDIIHNCPLKYIECNNCFMIYKSNKKINYKIKIFHQTYCLKNEYQKFKCYLCEKKFETSRIYENHFDTLYHNENLKKFIYLQEKEAQRNERYLMYEEEFNSIDIKNFQIDKKELIIKNGIYSGKSIEEMDDGYKKFIYKEKFKYQNFHIRVYLKNYFLTKNQSNAFLP